MWNHDDIGITAFDFAHHFKIAIGNVFLRSEIKLRGMLRLLRANRMRRASHALERQRGIHLHRYGQLTQRLGAQHVAAQAVAVAILISPQRQNLRVDDFDSLLRQRLDREHAGFEQIAGSPFQQAGIFPLALNRFVNFTSTLLFDDVGFDQIVADPHPEAANRSIRGQWKIELALQPAASVIDERFFNRRAGNLIANFDVDFVIADRERLVGAVGQGDN